MSSVNDVTVSDIGRRDTVIIEHSFVGSVSIAIPFGALGAIVEPIALLAVINFGTTNWNE